MALRLNLNHEIIQAQRARQRDPLKLSIMSLSLIAAGFAAYYFFQLAKMSGISQEYSQKKGEFDAIESKVIAAKAREDELAATILAGDTMVQRIEGRGFGGCAVGQRAQRPGAGQRGCGA